MLRNCLVPHNLDGDSEAYVARVLPYMNLNEDQFLSRVVERFPGRAKADLKKMLDEIGSTLEVVLLEGNTVTLQDVAFSVSIRRLFHGLLEPIDLNVHEVVVNAHAGARLRAIAPKFKHFERVEAGMAQGPRPVDLIDSTTKQQNGAITPGKGAKIIGKRLKFDENDPNQGVFFVNADGDAFRSPTTSTNKPSELVCEIPEGLAPGLYGVEVRAVFNGHADLRIGVMRKTVTVQ